jgi:nitroreductase
MQLKEVFEKRYSVRSFKDNSIDKASVDSILETARLIPTAHNLQPQRLLVLQSNEQLERLDHCTPCRHNAPLAIVVCYDNTQCWVRPFDNAKSGEIDASIAATQMMDKATDLGLGSLWVMNFDPPDTIIPVAILMIGYPAQDSQPSTNHGNRSPMERFLLQD